MEWVQDIACCVGRVVWVQGGSVVFYCRLIYGIMLVVVICTCTLGL